MRFFLMKSLRLVLTILLFPLISNAAQPQTKKRPLSETRNVRVAKKAKIDNSALLKRDSADAPAPTLPKIKVEALGSAKDSMDAPATSSSSSSSSSASGARAHVSSSSASAAAAAAQAPFASASQAENSLMQEVNVLKVENQKLNQELDGAKSLKQRLDIYQARLSEIDTLHIPKNHIKLRFIY